MSVISALSNALSSLFVSSPAREPEESRPSKTIAIVGAGTGGIGALKALLDLSDEIRQGWKIDVFEKTAHVGGMWVPEPNPPSPPELPNTPLYPALRTNTPHPTMTYPHFPFPPMTPLYPRHEAVRKYHADYLQHFNLTHYIHFEHTILTASYNPSTSQWDLTIQTKDTLFPAHYDHLIVAAGHDRYPHSPTWPGQTEWLKSGNGRRQIIHSMYYRGPERYAGHIVIVVGDGASGRDMAAQTMPLAQSVYHSYDTTSLRPVILPPVPGTHRKPRISHFTQDSIVFTDDTTLPTPSDTHTTLLLGTGYTLQFPFLSELAEAPPDGVDSSTTTLTTNGRYIRPLFRHVLSLDPSIPSNKLAFVGLPLWIANAPSDYAQGTLVAHAIADPSWLPSREVLLQDLANQEDDLRSHGANPYRYGHAYTSEIDSEAYLNGLITFLRQKSPTKLPPSLADSSKPYLEPWRRHAREQTWVMRRGWLRAEQLGIQDSFIEGAETEEDWVRVMQRVEEWEGKQQEEGAGTPVGVVEEPL